MRPGARPDYRACVIGRSGKGTYGHDIDLAFQGIPGVAVAAVADPDEKERQELARRAGAARSYADWREMLRGEKPRLVAVVQRWVEARVEMYTACAEVGAHVYTEKPIAESLEDADRIVAVAEKRGIKMAVAHHARVAPSMIHLRRLLGEGLIGDLLEMRSRGKEDHRAGGEDMMVLGTHCMYLMRYFGGEPLSCTARVTQDGRDVTAADRRAATEPLGPVAGDSIHAAFAFPGGVTGHFASQKNPEGGGGRFQLALFGSKGVVMIHIGADPEIRWLSDPKWTTGPWRPIPDCPSNDDPSGLKGFGAANKRIVEDLIRAVETGGEPVVSVREGRAALEMILAVYAAHLKGGRVDLPLKDRRHPLGSLR